MTNKALISGPVLVATLSTTNPDLNNNVEFLNDFNRMHERKMNKKSSKNSTFLFKNKSYSFLVSKDMAKKSSSYNYNNHHHHNNNITFVNHSHSVKSSCKTSSSSSTSSSICSTNSSPANHDARKESLNSSTLLRPNFAKIKTSLSN